MLPNLRGVFFLLASLVIFAAIVAVVTMGTVMKPGRWCERFKYPI
jgi:hypothetical protein